MASSRRSRRVGLALVFLALMALQGTTHGEGFWDFSWDAVREPERFSCEFKDDPHSTGIKYPDYVVRLPVIYQEAVIDRDTGEVEYQLLGFGYADNCRMKPEEDPDKEFGTGNVTVMVLPGVWKPDVLYQMRNMSDAFAQFNLKAEGTCPEGPYCPRSFEPIPVDYSSLYNEHAARLCEYPYRRHGQTLPVVCPGIPPALAHYLEDLGYRTYTDVYGVRRMVRVIQPTNSWGIWYNSALTTDETNGYESFFARHWSPKILADTEKWGRPSSLRGGVIRNIVEPANLALADVPASVPLENGKVVIPVNLLNQSIRAKLHGELKWRLAGDWPVTEAWRHRDNWRTFEGWRYAGEQKWRSTDEPIGSAPGHQYLPTFTAGVAGGVPIEVLVDGVSRGQTLELMVNPSLEFSEAVREDDDYRPAYHHAYSDNAVRTLVAPVDLSVLNLDVPQEILCPLQPTYVATWQLQNSSNESVRVQQTVSLTGRSGNRVNLSTKQVTMGPGPTLDNTTITVGLCDDDYEVSVEINPAPVDGSERAVDEIRYDNNRANKATIISARRDPPPPTPGGGGQDHIIVPKDCRVNPDAKSDYPCLNYPKLFIPRSG